MCCSLKIRPLSPQADALPQRKARARRPPMSTGTLPQGLVLQHAPQNILTRTPCGRSGRLVWPAVPPGAALHEFACLVIRTNRERRTRAGNCRGCGYHPLTPAAGNRRYRYTGTLRPPVPGGHPLHLLASLAAFGGSGMALVPITLHEPDRSSASRPTRRMDAQAARFWGCQRSDQHQSAGV